MDKKGIQVSTMVTVALSLLAILLGYLIITEGLEPAMDTVFDFFHETFYSGEGSSSPSIHEQRGENMDEFNAFVDEVEQIAGSSESCIAPITKFNESLFEDGYQMEYQMSREGGGRLRLVQGSQPITEFSNIEASPCVALDSEGDVEEQGGVNFIYNLVVGNSMPEGLQVDDVVFSDYETITFRESLITYEWSENDYIYAAKIDYPSATGDFFDAICFIPVTDDSGLFSGGDCGVTNNVLHSQCLDGHEDSFVERLKNTEDIDGDIICDGFRDRIN